MRPWVKDWLVLSAGALAGGMLGIWLMAWGCLW